jgi:inner membrane protein
MKWTNHIIIASSTTAIIEPLLIPAAALGATAPDWLETVANKIFSARWQHREQTHYLLFWIVAVLFFWLIWDFRGILTTFAWGGLTHILADSFTVMGVPFAPHSQNRFHLFGGRIRTGDSQEYIFSFTILIICLIIIFLTGGFNWQNTDEFVPFFYDWSGMYKEGLIDASEYKANRFRLF